MGSSKARLGENYPRLSGWFTMPQVAKLLGLSRARIAQLEKANKFENVHRVGRACLVIPRESVVKYACKAGLSIMGLSSSD